MGGGIGIWENGPVIRDLYQGLLAMQHRGQDSAGVITFDGRFHTKKGNGLVHDIFTPDALAPLPDALARERPKPPPPEPISRAVEAVYRKVRGSYSVVAYIADQGLVAFRD